MMNKERLPQIIQGGMGVGISSWQLARAVSMNGELGVVSGTAVALTLARRLMDGDLDGQITKALEDFPFQDIANRIKNKYSKSLTENQGKDKYKQVPMPTIDPGQDLLELIVVANYCEVHMAKMGHHGLVGINFLEKLQAPTLPSIYGAMLADVDYVLMGAGIPIRIPQVLTDLANNLDVSLPIKVADDEGYEPTLSHFSPTLFAGTHPLPNLKRPKFLAIVSSATLATHLSRSSFGSPDGFVVETAIAGGHNAPPRGKLILSDLGEPVYGERDIIDIKGIASLGLPFWLAGGYGTEEQYLYAKSNGAEGVQVGTAFALCDESGMEKSLKSKIIQAIKKGLGRVRTDPLASPTGFPFKVVELEGTNGIIETSRERKRICDLGYLREPYRKENGNIGYRCPSEPEVDYVAKGGKIEDTVGRLCLCNGLVSTMGLAQHRKNGDLELPIVTAGDDLKYILRYLSPGELSYKAIDVLRILLGQAFLKFSTR